jgi:hypothetical protein
LETGLLKYDRACRALAEAKTLDEVKDIKNIAMAMAAYAKQAKNLQLEADAAEIRLRAEKRLGEMMQKQWEVVGANRGGGDKRSDHRVSKKPSDSPPTLAEAGIDKNLADRARKAAALSPVKFEEEVQRVRKAVIEKPVEEEADGPFDIVSAWDTTHKNLMIEFGKRLEGLMRVAQKIIEMRKERPEGTDLFGSARYRQNVNAAVNLFTRLQGGTK